MKEAGEHLKAAGKSVILLSIINPIVLLYYLFGTRYLAFGLQTGMVISAGLLLFNMYHFWGVGISLKRAGKELMEK